MPRLGTHISQRAGISVSDFYKALDVLWHGHNGPRRGGKARLAIAVSGGVDSMALAQLCTILQKYPHASSDYHFHAFIVDHKAREESGLEAILVRQRLYRMGMSSTILSLNWPPGVRPLELPDFETQARRLRYRALGAGCRAKNISRLLVAHHADDQAETVLMRLCSGHKSVGLRGMHAFTEIPECWGIHGLHKSGGYEAKETTFAVHESKLSITEPALNLGFHGQRSQRSLPSSRLFEHGGVQVLRPLLKFRKQDLIDTCHAHGVSWSEDATNKDTWRTPRNAARSFLSVFSLPLALDKSSLLRLSSAMELRETQHNRYASQLNELCEILVFDLRSGGVAVRLPKQPNTEASITDAAHSGYRGFRQATASMLIRSLVRLVTPCEDVPLHSLKYAVAAMFPTPEGSEDANIDRRSETSKFTAAGVLFERVHSPLLDTEVEPNPGFCSDGRILRNQNLDTNFIWSLTRQPFANIPADVKLRGSKHALTTILIDESLSCKKDALAPSLWSPWHLWDGRYWIRIKNLTNQPLKVRPFNESDLQIIRKSIPKSVRKQFEELLASAAPSKVRWTLPVIAHAVEEDAKSAKVLVLPTLGKLGIIDVEDENGHRKVEWEVRYKMVDLGRRREDGARRNTDMIMSWEDS